ncbi:MAG: flagellar M-ring protein FliF [Gammaproteobacteria bacterium]|nr:flagellar M-ring protein FliF [Gammaproteobacteria bacterium]
MADSDLSAAGGEPLNPLVAGFNSLALWRQLGLMVGLAASIAVGFGVVIWAQEANYRPLYTDISNIDAVAVSDVLQQAKIPFKFDTNQGMVLVAEEKIHEARLKMAASGYSPSEGAGRNLLDKDSSFGTSQFIENARYHRSIELELAKTISSIESVRGARVHLAIPKRSVFVGDKRRPSASVLVDMNSGRLLDKAQVSAIVNLVASSIPELSDKMVTVVDHKGNLLSDNDEDGGIAQAGKQYEFSRKLEQNYIKRISNLLAPILGDDRFKVEVSADVDFTQFEQASEQFNPDMPAVRSEKILDEERGGTGFGGVPGALANQPPADASVPQVAGGGGGDVANQTSNRRSQATRNFELDRTVSHTRREFGTLQRLSVAIVVDSPPITSAEPVSVALPEAAVAGTEDSAATNAETTAKLDSGTTALSVEQIEQLSALVKGAIGYDVGRGDTVTVIPQLFLKPELITVEEQVVEIWEEPWFQSAMKQVLAALVLIVVLFGVLRPILKNISTSGAKDLEMGNMLGGAGADAPFGAVGGDLDENVMLSSGPDALLPGPNDGYNQQLTAVKSMVSEDPRRVAQVMKSWLSNDG